MGEMELVLNLHAAKAAPGGVAEYLGHCDVPREAAVNGLTPGLWLVRVAAGGHDPVLHGAELSPTPLIDCLAGSSQHNES